jgi:predicted nucleic acid-binding Zn ribbon protein
VVKQSIQAQVNEVTQFTAWIAGAFFILWMGKTVSGMEKNLVNKMLDITTPENMSLRIPQTNVVTVTCPICGKVIEIPQYNSVTRTEALRRHIEKEHSSIVGQYLPSLDIGGGESIPSQYHYLIGWLDETLPEYSLLTELMPAVEATSGERKIDAVLKQLKDGVESIQRSDNFRQFLTTMAKFHDYSIGNQLLIMLQRPEATRVAGFNTWKDMGRWVKSGEKGIAILAPIFQPRATCPACGARLPRGARFCSECGKTVEIEVEVSLRYFKVVYVFDVSQTEGKPLPEVEVPVLTGDINEELFASMLELMKRQGVSVSFESRPFDDPELKGFYRHADNLIWVRPEEPGAQQLKTLLHESAHYYTEGVFHIPRADAETIAESAAFVVAAHYGFDTGVRSFPYVAIWAQDKKVLEQNLGSIRQVATSILEQLEKSKTSSLISATIPVNELMRIADKYGWWAAKLAEAVCPHNDVACVEREAKRLITARTSR